MKAFKIRYQGTRTVKVVLSQKMRVDLQITKILTGKNFGATLEEAYLYAKKHGFAPNVRKAS